jgi:hypothetical protein
MRPLVTILLLFLANATQAAAIRCDVVHGDTVVVTMKTPHPQEALVYRPGGETVWLHTSSQYLPKGAASFGDLGKWVISPDSTGTVWVDGKATVQPVIKEEGRYHLYIAKNAETEPENTYFIECYFVIRKIQR